MTKWLLLIALIGWLSSGVYVIQPDEQAIVRRFGAMHGNPLPPGLHWGLPWGLDLVSRIKPREVKRIVVGIAVDLDRSAGSEPRQYLTGDRNLINVRAAVQYTIKDPRRFLFAAVDGSRLTESAAAAAFAELLAGRSVDSALTEAKQELGILSVERLQARADAYGLGIQIRAVEWSRVEPPAEVAAAFDQVTAALRERERAVHDAKGFAQRTIAEAQATAQQTINEAKASRDRTIHRADGESSRFESLLTEYRRSPSLTASRMYLETMAEVLPRLQSKVASGAGADIDLSILREETP